MAELKYSSTAESLSETSKESGFAAPVVVSDDSESLILVDSADKHLGYASKSDCHDGDGILHRAFSLFLFNTDGELLLQQRSEQKRLWPLYWSNSCCSHPRRGETMELAAGRRLKQELGMEGSLRYLYKFEYHARFGDLGSEHELCSVFVGNSTQNVQANATEIAAWRYVKPEALDEEVANSSDKFTPWFKMEWQQLKSDFQEALRACGADV